MTTPAYVPIKPGDRLIRLLPQMPYIRYAQLQTAVDKSSLFHDIDHLKVGTLPVNEPLDLIVLATQHFSYDAGLGDYTDAMFYQVAWQGKLVWIDCQYITPVVERAAYTTLREDYPRLMDPAPLNGEGAASRVNGSCPT